MSSASTKNAVSPPPQSVMFPIMTLTKKEMKARARVKAINYSIISSVFLG